MMMTIRVVIMPLMGRARRARGRCFAGVPPPFFFFFETPRGPLQEAAAAPPIVARVVAGTYAAAACDVRFAHGVVVALAQPPGNQFHALLSTLAPLLAIDRAEGTTPTLFFDAHNGAARLFATNATAAERRERRQRRGGVLRRSP